METFSPVSVNSFLTSLEENGMSPQTLRAYRADLMGFLEWAPGENHWPLERWVKNYLNEHRKMWAPKTTLRKISSFRSWGKWAGDANFLADYRGPKPAKAIAHPIPEGINGVLDLVDSTVNDRHHALVALCGLMGLRVSEARGVTAKDFNLEYKLLRVHGKGDKYRDVPVPATAWAFLGHAFARSAQDGSRLVTLSDRGARAAITRLGLKACLARPIASHDLRATLLTAAYNKTHDLRAVQEIAGHASSKTTEAYVGVTVQSMRNAIEVV